MYLISTCMPGESYCRRLRYLLLSLCYVFCVRINSLVCWFCTNTLGLILFQIHFPSQINIFSAASKYLWTFAQHVYTYMYSSFFNPTKVNPSHLTAALSTGIEADVKCGLPNTKFCLPFDFKSSLISWDNFFRVIRFKLGALHHLIMHRKTVTISTKSLSNHIDN